MVICTFIGHRDILTGSLDSHIADAFSKLFKTDTDFVFLVGGMGSFDERCALAVRKAKRENPHLNIKLILILPYMTNRLNTNKEYYISHYDEIIIPSELCDIYYKSAIIKRNRLMVDRSDLLIAYVYRSYGGAFETLKYARKCGKKIINLADDEFDKND